MRTFFYCTQKDFVGVMARIDSEQLYHYVRCGDHPHPEVQLLTALSDYVAESVLVVRRSTEVGQVVIENDRNLLYRIDQSTTPDSILFFTGGTDSDGSLIPGWISNASTSWRAVELFRYFSRNFRKDLTLYKNYWFGREALQMVTSGTPLVKPQR